MASQKAKGRASDDASINQVDRFLQQWSPITTFMAAGALSVLDENEIPVLKKFQ